MRKKELEKERDNLQSLLGSISVEEGSNMLNIIIPLIEPRIKELDDLIERFPKHTYMCCLGKCPHRPNGCRPYCTVETTDPSLEGCVKGYDVTPLWTSWMK